MIPDALVYLRACIVKRSLQLFHNRKMELMEERVTYLKSGDFQSYEEIIDIVSFEYNFMI